MLSLKVGATQATIDPQGAWIASLTDSEAPILFAQTNIALLDGGAKQRGGCHVCVPNFGPGGESGLAQHGFGRVLPWQVVASQPDGVLLELRGGAPGYEGLVSRLTYTLGDAILEMRLTLQNTGETPLAVAPAFHPYFALPVGTKRVTVGEQVYDITKLAGTEFMYDTAHLAVQLGDRSLRLDSTNLPAWAVWTDQLGDYVCVEPTTAGNVFAEGVPPQLAPRESRDYSLRIQW